MRFPVFDRNYVEPPTGVPNDAQVALFCSHCTRFIGWEAPNPIVEYEWSAVRCDCGFIGVPIKQVQLPKVDDK